MSEISSVNISNNGENFGVTLQHSVQIYSINPVKRVFLKDFVNCTITHMSIIDDGSMISFSTRNVTPIERKYKAVIWNIQSNQLITEISLDEEILSLHLSRQFLLIVLINSVIVYDISQRKTQCEQLTSENSRGTADLIESDKPLVAICGLQVGSVHVSEIVSSSKLSSSSDADFSDLKDFDVIGFKPSISGDSSSIIFQAHSHPLAAIKFSPDGSLIATSSEKGTVVRLFDAFTGNHLSTFRRGNIPSNILALCFSQSNSELIAVSDNGTAHLFQADIRNGNPIDPPRSVAKVKIEKGIFVKAAFKSDDELFIVSSSGHLYQINCGANSLEIVDKIFVLLH